MAIAPILALTKSSTWCNSSSVTFAKWESQNANGSDLLTNPFVPHVFYASQCLISSASQSDFFSIWSWFAIHFSHKIPLTFSGNFLVKCRIRLFSFLVSIIWIVSFAETKTLYLPLVLRLQDKMVCYLKRFGTPLFLESTLRILVILLRFLFDHNLRRSPYFPPLKSSNHPLKLQSCVNVFLF
jgi:hypothetical protein